MLRGAVQRRKVFLLLSDAGALTPAVLRALRLARRARTPVEVVVLDFTVNAGPPDEPLRGLPVRRFWLDAAPAGGGGLPRHNVTDLEQRPVVAWEEDWRAGYYQDGLPVLAISERGRATVVDHYGRHGRPVRRDELDLGKLIRIIDLHPSTGQEVTHRYLDAGGDCWLSVWVDPDGTLGRTQRHRGQVREFADYRAAQGDWVAGLIAHTRRPLVLTAGRPAAEVAARLSD